MLVVDASAVLEALAGVDPPADLLARLGADGDLHAPHLVDIEVLHALRRLSSQGELSDDRAADARSDFSDLAITRYPHLGLSDRIWELRHNLTAYDAAYVALAETLEVPLVTCDRRVSEAPAHRAAIELKSSGELGPLSLDDRARATRVLTDWLKQLVPRQRELALERLSEQLGVCPEPTQAVLTWSTLKELQRQGLTVAGHSRTHELLDLLDGAELTEELAGCRDDLVRELGCCAPLFAYPNGNVDRRVIRTMESAGFNVGFTTVRGVNYLGKDDVRLLRRDDGRMSRLLFAFKLSGAIARLRTRRHALPV